MTQSQAKSAIASVASSMNKKNAPKQRIPEESLSAKKDNLQEDTARQIIAQMIQTTEQDTEKFMGELREDDCVLQQKSTAHIAQDIVQNAIDNSSSAFQVSLDSIPEAVIAIPSDTYNHSDSDMQYDDTQATNTQETMYQAQQEEESSNNNIFFQNNIIDIVRENIEKIHNHSFAFADNIYDSRISAVNSASVLQETTLESVGNISNACFEAVSKSVACETPTDFIANQMECASKIQKAYSDMFSTIGKESYKTWRETWGIFIMPKC